MSVNPTLPVSSGGSINLNDICARSCILILGVTGGIASGKSTVADMLKGIGAPIIDFDLLARQVVEPGKPAWREIVSYFGKEILQVDGNLDRKRLSKVVFQDPDRRKRLEGFTHPYMDKEFVKQVAEIARTEPDAIIQAVIPLLFEVNISSIVHKTLVVYIPREKQIERMIKRDSISREEAINILEAQLSIDEKASRADYVIHNDNSFEETRRQVKAIWRELKQLQKENGSK